MKQSFWRIDKEHTVLEGPEQLLGMKLEHALEIFKQGFGDFTIEIQKQPFIRIKRRKNYKDVVETAKKHGSDHELIQPDKNIDTNERYSDLLPKVS